VPSIFKEFPAPSVDNPALLAQYACALADRYRQLFSSARGFAVELQEKKSSSRSQGWELRILHGMFGGADVALKPITADPRVIEVRAGKTSRMEFRLQKIAGALAFVVMFPFLLAALYVSHGRLLFALLLLAPFFFIVLAILVGIATLIGRALSGFDHAFSDVIRQRILKVAEELPLPDRLQGPTPPPPHPNAQPISAFPQRPGMWGSYR
jgi:hypothetical protein